MILWGLDFIKLIQSTLESPVMDFLMKIISFLGNGSVYFVWIVVLYWCINEKQGFALGTGLMISLGINDLVKMTVKEKRPFQLDYTLGKDFELSYSFPSGHSQSAGTFFGITCGSLRKWYNWIYLILPPFLIGFSRVYLGVHFPHDVLAGLALGYGAGAFYILGYRKTARKISGLKTSVKLFICALVSLVLIKFGQPLSPLPGAFFGFTAGYILLGAGKGFEASSGSLAQKIMRFLLGITALLVIVVFFKKTGLGVITGQVDLFNFICWFLCGIWVSWGAPLVFVLLGLAKRPDRKQNG